MLLVALAVVVVVVCLLLTLTLRARGGSPTITAYTQPWCGACQRLAPEWARLEQIAPPDLAAVKVDCSTDDCSAVQKYPTIVCNGQEYAGERTAGAMKAWALGVS